MRVQELIVLSTVVGEDKIKLIVDNVPTLRLHFCNFDLCNLHS